MESRHLSVVGGTGAARPRYIDPGATAQYVETAVVNEHGNAFLREEAAHQSGGGDGSMRLTLPDLRWNVAILNGLAALFAVALVGSFLWMVDRIDDKFEAAQEDVADLSEKLGDLRVEIAGQRADIRMVLEKIDGQSQGSAGSGQVGAVRGGTPEQPPGGR